MVRNAVGYIVGIALIGSILAFAVSILINVLQYISVGAVIIFPFLGAYRRRKDWMYESLGLKRWLSVFRKVFRKVFRIGKPRLTFYLIVVIVIGFTYEQIAITVGFVVGGLVIMLIVWESVRYVALKARKVEMVSFSEAFKSTW